MLIWGFCFLYYRFSFFLISFSTWGAFLATLRVFLWKGVSGLSSFFYRRIACLTTWRFAPSGKSKRQRKNRKYKELPAWFNYKKKKQDLQDLSSKKKVILFFFLRKEKKRKNDNKRKKNITTIITNFLKKTILLHILWI